MNNDKQAKQVARIEKAKKLETSAVAAVSAWAGQTKVVAFANIDPEYGVYVKFNVYQGKAEQMILADTTADALQEYFGIKEWIVEDIVAECHMRAIENTQNG